MELSSGSKARSGCRVARKKRSDLYQRPQSNPKPDTLGQDALTFLADYAGRGNLKSYHNANGNMCSDAVICGLPSDNHMRSNINHKGGLRVSFIESGSLGNQNKLKKLKRKLDSITRPLHAKAALQTASGSRPVVLRSSDSIDGCCVLQKQKSEIGRGRKRSRGEEEHIKDLSVPPMSFEHVTSLPSPDSSLQLIPVDIPDTSLQNSPTSSSSSQSLPICSALRPAGLFMHPPSNHQSRDMLGDFSSSRWTSAASDKTLISPNGSGFYPNHVEVIHCISRIIQSKFDEPWPTWNKVPTNVRDRWFNEFQEWYYWQPDHARQIRLNFEARGMARLKDMFCSARKNLSVRPFWLSAEVWDGLIEYWDSPEFKAKSEQAKINRASDCDGLGPSLHTCGCIPMSEHKRRLEEKTGEEVTPIKLFAHTHQRKDKTWIDARSAQAYEKFMREWNDVQSGENTTVLDCQGERQTSTQPTQLTQPTQPAAGLSEAELWVKTNLTRKGTVYGVGSEAVNYKCSKASISQSKEKSTRWFDSPEFQKFLSKKVMEISSEWNARLEEERRETEELRKRVAELEKEKQEKKSKKKAKKKLKQMKEMMKMLQMSYESLSKAHSSSDDDDDSTDSD